MESWKSVFNDLKRLRENVIVEAESLEDDESDFVIGKIEGVCKRFAYVRHFDADGVWEPGLRKIPYMDITSVTFASRYIRFFSKYLGKAQQSVEKSSMDVWTDREWEKKPLAANTRSGLRLVFDSDVDAEVRRSCKEFCQWLRRRYQFPMRVPVYIKSCKKLVTGDGGWVLGTFFEPYNRHVEPYIRVATGDYAETEAKFGKDNALAGILESIVHELTHYFQWLNDIRLTRKGMERQAVSYANRILNAYAEIRKKP